MTAVSRIIVNYRMLTMIDECFISLVSYVSNALIRVVVGDNNFGNYSLKVIVYWCVANIIDSIVNIYSLSRNLAFTEGNNFGIRIFSAGDYLLLNNDTLAKL